MKHPITLQINTAPVDFPYFPKILRHQLRHFGSSVNEILITIETRQSKKSRWKSDEWDTNLEKIFQLCEELKRDFPYLKANPIDYSDSTRKEISQYFMRKNKQLIPFKDFRGGPYYSYYFGLFSANEKYVLHMDSDMMFHGNGAKWLDQAMELNERDPKALLISPIIGPPVLPDQKMPLQHPKRYNPIFDYEFAGNGYAYKDMSTRVFMVEKERLKNFCPVTYPHFDQIAKSWLRKTPPYHTPERSISEAMQRAGLYRVDFQGKDEGLYSIHPQIAKDPDFPIMLDFIIGKIEEGFFLEEMRGLQDFTPTFYKTLKESFRKEKKTSP